MAYLDRGRAERLMAEAGLDALLLLGPESFRYATGAEPGVAAMWRWAGAFAVLVPADRTVPETAVVSDLFAAAFRRSSHITDLRESPIWVETAQLDGADPDAPPEDQVAAAWQAAGRAPDFTRPETFDASVTYGHVASALAERGSDRARVGYEGAAVSVRDFAALSAALAPAELVEAGGVIDRLKAVKGAGEIRALRTAVTVAEAGFHAVRGAVHIGASRADLAAAWQAGIAGHPDAGALTGAWEYISVGPDPWGAGAPAQAGDIVKVDAGCLVEGYTSDSGRTFVLGGPSALQARLHDALRRGFDAGAALIGPGVPLADVHRATLAAIRAEGFPGYTRGHFGHGLGTGPGSEAWPFISARTEAVFEPGMVLAFEAPWYIDGVGGFILENQLLVTDAGHEMMNTLPLDLVQVAT